MCGSAHHQAPYIERVHGVDYPLEAVYHLVGLVAAYPFDFAAGGVYLGDVAVVPVQSAEGAGGVDDDAGTRVLMLRLPLVVAVGYECQQVDGQKVV